MENTMTNAGTNATGANLSLPIAIIGAGPVGLAAAAHVVSRGLVPLIFESGAAVAANLESVAHVRLFSPWRYDIDQTARQLLEATGWIAPDPDQLPTAGELRERYLLPLSRLPQIAPYIKFGHRVSAITRSGIDKVKTKGRNEMPFHIRVHGSGGSADFLARAVIDASGTWNQPNPAGASGIPAMGEAENAGSIVYGMPDVLGGDRNRYAGKHVLVVGSGHSAAGTLIALAELAEREPGTLVSWAVRGTDLTKVFGGGDADGLPARGELGKRIRNLRDGQRLVSYTAFRIREMRRVAGKLSVSAEDGRVIDGIDEFVVATGSRPDLNLARELRLKLDPWLESTESLAPLIDPNVHSCGTVPPHGHRELRHPESGYYTVGAKSYGRAPNFLLATGYEQTRSVVAAIAGDLKAADKVQLELPQTGVCSSNLGGEGAACCGGPAPSGVDACCALDADAKAAGETGCGCGTSTPVAPHKFKRLEVQRLV